MSDFATAQYVIGLGSNLGSRDALLRAAVAQLDARGAKVLRVSSVHTSKPLIEGQPDYQNAAVLVQWNGSPQELLTLVLSIETTLGRVRDPEVRWSPRTLDLDLLWAKDLISDDPTVTIPHPRLHERAFALLPLLELVPDAQDPRSKKPYQAMLDALPKPHAIETPSSPGLLDRVAWERMDHTADEGFSLTARDRADAFAAAAETLGALSVDPASVRAMETQSITLTAPDEGPWPEDERLFAWLSEVLYRMDAGRFAIARAVVFDDAPTTITGLLLGEPLDEARHGVRGALKAITYHAMETGSTNHGYRVQVVIDV